MKYIVLAVSMGGLTREVPVIFPDFLIHSDVADAMVKGNETLRGAKAISAGFLSMFDTGIETNGKSGTLGLSSRGKVDDDLIMMYDYFHGIATPHPGFKIPKKS